MVVAWASTPSSLCSRSTPPLASDEQATGSPLLLPSRPSPSSLGSPASSGCNESMAEQSNVVAGRGEDDANRSLAAVGLEEEDHYSTASVGMDDASYLRKVNLKTYSSCKDLSMGLQKMLSCFITGDFPGYLSFFLVRFALVTA
ncbi:auxin-responsive protein IAA5-like [Phragmites australis]|uniref:auxin-responsive protein IAA5-like n=1 Tax=Phragmites australis TaxID=29695 RepID=UPI002D7938D1|nr:auxin-responsive protein IAA5-like [Phragmites australis]